MTGRDARTAMSEADMSKAEFDYNLSELVADIRSALQVVDHLRSVELDAADSDPADSDAPEDTAASRRTRYWADLVALLEHDEEVHLAALVEMPEDAGADADFPDAGDAEAASAQVADRLREALDGLESRPPSPDVLRFVALRVGAAHRGARIGLASVVADAGDEVVEE